MAKCDNCYWKKHGYGWGVKCYQCKWNPKWQIDNYFPMRRLPNKDIAEKKKRETEDDG